jgi:hypothetical protein
MIFHRMMLHIHQNDLWQEDTQQNYNLQNDTQHNDIPQNDTQHNDKHQNDKKITTVICSKTITKQFC